MASVWYIGSATERRIFDRSFNPSNGWSIPEEAFTIGQLVQLDEDDGFLLGQADGPRTQSFSPDHQNGPDAYLAEIRRLILEGGVSSGLSIIDNGDGTITLRTLADPDPDPEP